MIDNSLFHVFRLGEQKLRICYERNTNGKFN